MILLSIVGTIVGTIAGSTAVFFQVVYSGMTSTSNSSANEENSNDGDHNRNHESPVKKGPWTTEEDEILAAYVTKHGIGNWNTVKKNTGLLRCGKSCRLRWTNHLRPDLKRCVFSSEEQQKIIQLHALWGNKWAKMAQELPGRTDNEIKNFWNTRLKKRKRAGLPIYPEGIKPSWNSNSSDNSSTNSLDDSTNNLPTEDPSYNVPEMIFNNYKLSENHPLPVQPNHQYACSSDHSSQLKPSMLSILDDDALRDNHLPQTQFYQRASPRSNGYLESILYPPKILEGSDNFLIPRQLSNLEIRENLEFLNPDYVQDTGWVENYNKDQYDIKDTLFSIVDPFLPRNTSP